MKVEPRFSILSLWKKERKNIRPSMVPGEVACLGHRILIPGKLFERENLFEPFL